MYQKGCGCKMIVSSGEIRNAAALGRWYRPEDRRAVIAKRIVSDRMRLPVSELTAMVLPGGNVAVRRRAI